MVKVEPLATSPLEYPPITVTVSSAPLLLLSRLTEQDGELPDVVAQLVTMDELTIACSGDAPKLA